MTGTDPAGAAGHSFPVAGLDRRFYAFVLDRLLLWAGYAVVALAAYHWLIDPGNLWAGVGAIAGAVLLAWLVTAMLVGTSGVTPAGYLVGLRIVSDVTGGPIGAPRALLRGAVLGLATLPTFGFGTAALAVTAVGDSTGRRRGWHDLRAGSVVVDVRPEPVVEIAEEEPPSPVVNLTALRLIPASPHPPSHVPARQNRALAKPLPPRLGPHTSSRPPASPTPRQGLGWPLVGSAPDEQSGAPATLGPTAPAPRPSTSEVSAAVTPSAPAPVTPAPITSAPRAAPPPPPVTAPPAAPPAEPPVEPPVEREVQPPARQPVEATVPSPAPPGSRAEGGTASDQDRPRWQVAFDTGESFEVAGLTLVGRRPEPREGEPAKRLVALPSDDMSLSKTHAQFQVVPDGALVVMDRGSTNGSILIRAGVTKQLAGGRPQTLRDGDRVRFGDREMTVTRAGG